MRYLKTETDVDWGIIEPHTVLYSATKKLLSLRDIGPAVFLEDYIVVIFVYDDDDDQKVSSVWDADLLIVRTFLLLGRTFVSDSTKGRKSKMAAFNYFKQTRHLELDMNEIFQRLHAPLRGEEAWRPKCRH